MASDKSGESQLNNNNNNNHILESPICDTIPAAKDLADNIKQAVNTLNYKMHTAYENASHKIEETMPESLKNINNNNNNKDLENYKADPYGINILNENHSIESESILNKKFDDNVPLGVKMGAIKPDNRSAPVIESSQQMIFGNGFQRGDKVSQRLDALAVKPHSKPSNQ